MLAMYTVAIILFSLLLPRMKGSRTTSVKVIEGGQKAKRTVSIVIRRDIYFILDSTAICSIQQFVPLDCYWQLNLSQ